MSSFPNQMFGDKALHQRDAFGTLQEPPPSRRAAQEIFLASHEGGLSPHTTGGYSIEEDRAAARGR
jgi:hypothetical protein